MKYSPTDIARQYLFVREASQNKGQRVEAIQKWSGGDAGQSWCCYFVTMVLDICFQGTVMGKVVSCIALTIVSLIT